MATPIPILRYPYNVLSDKTDYLKINVIEYKAPGLSNPNRQSLALPSSEQSLSDNLQKPKATIFLPMPQNIGDSNAVGWGDDKFGGFAAVGAETAMNIIQGRGAGDAIGAVYDTLQAGLKNLQSGTGQQGMSAGLAGAAINALGGQPDINSLIGRATGAIINQNVELLFQNVTIRQPFSFIFDLVPRFKRETEEIQKIIRVLKQESAAKKGNQAEPGGGFFIKAPNVFQLQYMSGSNPHPFLHKFKTTALIGMSVNYTASGTYATYSDATPVHMQLTLNFQELTPIYAEDYDTQIGKEAVGY